MSARVKQKSQDVIMIRTGGPIETAFVLNYLNNMKRLPPQMRPFKDVSVKNLRGDEIKLPEPMSHPPMELKPRVETPITIKPATVASGQVVTVVGGKPIPGNVPSGQVVHIAPQLAPEPPKTGPTISLAPQIEMRVDPEGKTDILPVKDVAIQKIAEGIAIGKAADAVQKMVEEKKE
jgi:hypothetical protein